MSQTTKTRKLYKIKYTWIKNRQMNRADDHNTCKRRIDNLMHVSQSRLSCIHKNLGSLLFRTIRRMTWFGSDTSVHHSCKFIYIFLAISNINSISISKYFQFIIVKNFEPNSFT